MRSTAVRAKLIDDATMSISLHHILRMLSFGTHVQCTCGAIVRIDDWNRHIGKTIVDKCETFEIMEES
jgi:hypothetical protein